jgi:hypothetical protein
MTVVLRFGAIALAVVLGLGACGMLPRHVRPAAAAHP